MKKALVLGATGGMGYSLVHELVGKKINVVAFARNQEKLERLFSPSPYLSFFVGDAFNLDDVRQAANGVDIIFHTVSIPYEKWKAGHPTLMKLILEVALEKQAKLVIVDNIYAYGQQTSKPIKEDTLKAPTTKKGNIRLALEKMASDYQKQGLDILFAHFPDFYGPNAASTYLHSTFTSLLNGKRPIFVGPLDVPREFIYTPDGAKALVALALQTHTYNEHWNIPGHSTITGNEIINIANSFVGQSKKPLEIKKWMIAMLGIINPFMREVKEMMYLTKHSHILCGEKCEKHIGPIPKTPYEVGIIQTLQWIQKTEKNIG